MARLESESKGGYYPTPSKEMAHILKRVVADYDARVTLLDPCAGKGEALRQAQNYLLKIGADPVSYGIEIEKNRAEAAAGLLDHTISCGYEDARMSHKAFSFLYLNPPFMQVGRERSETIFFRDLTQADSYLTDGALVILNIPQYVLADVARLIAIRLENVKVYRFTDENYPLYKQIIVYGYRKKAGTGRDTALHQELVWLSRSSGNALSVLDEEDGVQYKVPEPMRTVELFQSGIVELDDIFQSLSECDFLNKVTDKIKAVKLENAKAQNPAMPLKLSHYATAIAAGALPEKMGDHMLVGVTKRVQTERTEVDNETGKEKETVTFRPKSLVRVFSKQGIFDLE